MSALSRVAVVSTYPPRACGIATFARDLHESLGDALPAADIDVVAIVRDGAPTDPAVVARIRQEVRGDYVAAARALDRRGTDVAVVQHEYGIFGGADGALRARHAGDGLHGDGATDARGERHLPGRPPPGRPARGGRPCCCRAAATAPAEATGARASRRCACAG